MSDSTTVSRIAAASLATVSCWSNLSARQSGFSRILKPSLTLTCLSIVFAWASYWRIFMSAACTNLVIAITATKSYHTLQSFDATLSFAPLNLTCSSLMASFLIVELQAWKTSDSLGLRVWAQYYSIAHASGSCYPRYYPSAARFSVIESLTARLLLWISPEQVYSWLRFVGTSRQTYSSFAFCSIQQSEVLHEPS